MRPWLPILAAVLAAGLAAVLPRRRAATGPFTWTAEILDHDYVTLTEDDGRTADVPAAGHTVRLAVTGHEREPVTLTGLRAEVVERADRHGDLARHGGEVPERDFEVLLDRDPPVVRSLAGEDFPFRVAAGETEVLTVAAHTGSGDVRWLLWLDWTRGERAGALPVDLHGRPFRTAARQPVPR